MMPFFVASTAGFKHAIPHVELRDYKGVCGWWRYLDKVIFFPPYPIDIPNVYFNAQDDNYTKSPIGLCEAIDALINLIRSHEV